MTTSRLARPPPRPRCPARLAKLDGAPARAPRGPTAGAMPTGRRRRLPRQDTGRMAHCGASESRTQGNPSGPYRSRRAPSGRASLHAVRFPSLPRFGRVGHLPRRLATRGAATLGASYTRRRAGGKGLHGSPPSSAAEAWSRARCAIVASATSTAGSSARRTATALRSAWTGHHRPSRPRSHTAMSNTGGPPC